MEDSHKKAVLLLWGLFLAAGLWADPVEGCWLSIDEKTGLDTTG
jgi:hypothetical protein